MSENPEKNLRLTVSFDDGNFQACCGVELKKQKYSELNEISKINIKNFFDCASFELYQKYLDSLPVDMKNLHLKIDFLEENIFELNEKLSAALNEISDLKNNHQLNP